MKAIEAKLKEVFSEFTPDDFIGEDIIQIKRENIFVQVIKWSCGGFDIKIFFRLSGETLNKTHLPNKGHVIDFINTKIHTQVW